MLRCQHRGAFGVRRDRGRHAEIAQFNGATASRAEQHVPAFYVPVEQLPLRVKVVQPVRRRRRHNRHLVC